MVSEEKQAAAPVALEGLPDSMALLGNPEKLNERWANDGVLYFKQAVAAEAIGAVREQYLDRLKELGLVAPEATKPVWTGKNRLDGKLARKIDDGLWRGLVAHPSFHDVVARFLGEEPAWVPIVVHRCAPPAGPAAPSDEFQGRHQDGMFNYGIDFITCWVPMMDVDPIIGGLAVAPGSHKQSYYVSKDNGLTGPGSIPYGKIAESMWRRPDYKAGDILMFHSMTAHAGLHNHSDLFRLSVDIRFLPGSALKPVVGTVVKLDGEVVDIAGDAGEHLHLDIDDESFVRGPKGNRVVGNDINGVLFPGANVIAVRDRTNHARLVRSVSRKYMDVPAGWFEELPAGWVS